MSNPVQGWHADPAGTDQLRWWDGEQWTDRYQAAPASNTTTDSETSNAAGDAAATRRYGRLCLALSPTNNPITQSITP